MLLETLKQDIEKNAAKQLPPEGETDTDQSQNQLVTFFNDLCLKSLSDLRISGLTL